MEQQQPIIIKTASVGCDGGEGPEGRPPEHPKVYLRVGADGEIVCPYCARRYKQYEGAAPAADH